MSCDLVAKSQITNNWKPFWAPVGTCRYIKQRINIKLHRYSKYVTHDLISLSIPQDTFRT